MSGFDGAVEVLVEHIDASDLASMKGGIGPATRVAARLPAHLSPLTVTSPRPATLSVLDPRPAVMTGDPSFDRRIHVSGPSALVAPALTEAARNLLLGWVLSRRGAVRGGWVEVLIPGREWRAERLEDVLAFAVQVARALTYPEMAAPFRLSETALRDAAPGARAVALRRALELFPSAPETEAAVEASLDAEMPELRLLAARASPARGVAVAKALLESDTLEPGARAEALGLIARAEGGVQPAAELLQLLRSRDPTGQAAAARVLAEVGALEAASDLYALSHRRFVGSEVRRAATLALDRLRERFGQGREGALSLCGEGAAGALAHSEGD